MPASRVDPLPVLSLQDFICPMEADVDEDNDHPYSIRAVQRANQLLNNRRPPKKVRVFLFVL